MKIDTTPDYPEQSSSLIEAAERDLPAVLQDMPNETGSGAGDPGHGHRVVLAEKLVEGLAAQKGHSRAVAAWAVHRLVERGLLRCEVAREFYTRVIGHRQVPGRVMFGMRRYREELVYGTTEVPLADLAAGPVPYRHLLVYSTEQLWQWWRSINSMPPTDPDMDRILREVQAKRQRNEAAEQLYQEQLARWMRLRDAFQAAAGFCMHDYAAELGREPTQDEFYRAWAERMAIFGRIIRDQGLVDWVEREYRPDSLGGQWTRGMLLRASKTPDDVAGLRELLEQSGTEPELHAVRHRIRDVGEQLLKQASPPMTTNEDADSLDQDLAALRGECRKRRQALDVWNVTRHGNQNFPADCVRELWQKVRGIAYGTAGKAPPREPDKVPDVPAALRALDEVVRWCEEQENTSRKQDGQQPASGPATPADRASDSVTQTGARSAAASQPDATPPRSRHQRREPVEALAVDPDSINTPVELREWCLDLQAWFRRNKKLLGYTEVGRKALLDRPTRADEAIQKVWQCLRRLAVPRGAKYPEPQSAPTSLEEAVRQLDPVINWCLEQEREMVEEATLDSPSQSSTQVSVGIVIALKEEFNELFREIKKTCTVEVDSLTGNHFYRFERAGASAPYQCVATWAGEMGPEKAILITERLLTVWNPKVVVNIGIAAGVDKDVRVGDALISTHLDNYLHRSKAVASETGDGFSLDWSGAVYSCSQDLIAAVRNFQFAHENNYREWRNRGASRLKKFVPAEQRSQLIEQDLVRKSIEYTDGHLASGPIVGASSAFREWLKTRDRAFLGLEMEAAGVLAALHVRADLKRSMILRGISDYGDERKEELDKIKAGALRRYAMCNALHLLWLLLKVDALPH